MADSRSFRRVSKVSAYGIQPHNSEQSFAMRALLDPEIQLVTIAGKAGTGKTLLALVAALETASKYKQILLARPIVPLSNRDLGFLPGDTHQIDQPYLDALSSGLNYLISRMMGQSIYAHSHWKRANVLRWPTWRERCC